MCSAGRSIRKRFLVVKSNRVAVYTHEVIPCDGKVATWNLWTRQPGTLRAMIVRPVNGSSTEFTIVGINDITITSAMANQNITYTVPSCECIIAQNGDMIAVGTFNDTNNPELWATTSEGIVGLIEHRVLDPTTLSPGMTFTTTNTTRGTFSLSVATSTITPLSGNHANTLSGNHANIIE